MNEIDGVVADIQSRIAFQEDSLGTLDDIVAKQSREIQQLQAQLKALYKKVDALKDEVGQGSPESDSPPPHY